jgi:hydrogenase maturation protein HypF
VDDAYPFALEPEGEKFIIDPAPLVRALATDVVNAVSPDVISARFHNAVAAFLAAAAGRAREMTGLDVVALGGGVFQNDYLLRRLVAALRASRFRVLVHRQLPTNDGGISLGQAAVAAERVRLGLVSLE